MIRVPLLLRWLICACTVILVALAACSRDAPRSSESRAYATVPESAQLASCTYIGWACMYRRGNMGPRLLDAPADDSA